MAGVYRALIVSTLLLAIDSRPSCRFDVGDHVTICTPGDEDFVLKRGLVSDNNYTTGITLRQCRLTDIELSSFNGLFGLKQLDLSDNKLTVLRLGVLDGAREVTHLNLSFNNIQDLPLGLFDQKPMLQLLDLKGNQITGFQRGIFDPLQRLGHLDLSSNNFKGREIDQYMFDKNSYISFMDFSGSDMSETTDKLLRIFAAISFLNLSGCSLTEVPKFATATNLKTMNHLMLINNRITSIHNPATFHNLVNLQTINFGGNEIEFINKDVFRRLKKLRTVILNGNKLRDISNDLFRDLESLVELDLSNNLLQFVNVNAFRGTSLRSLNLSNNRFTYLSDNFILELSNSRASLRKFFFSENPWQCACLRDILKEAKARIVQYSDVQYNGKNVVCVTTKDFYCKRQPNFNELYIDMYDNAVK